MFVGGVTLPADGVQGSPVPPSPVPAWLLEQRGHGVNPACCQSSIRNPVCCQSSIGALNDMGILIKGQFWSDLLLGLVGVKSTNLFIYFWVNVSLVWMIPCVPCKPVSWAMILGLEAMGKESATLAGSGGDGRRQGFPGCFFLPFFWGAILLLAESSMSLCFCSSHFMWCSLGNVNVT